MAAENLETAQPISDPPAEADVSGAGETAEDFKRQIAELREALEKKDSEIRAVKVGAAVDAALTAAGARNITAVKALITGLDAMELSEDGSVVGLEERIAAIKASDGYLFEQRGFALRGAKPAESGADALDEGADISKMTYSQLSEFIRKNPSAKIFD